MKTTDAAELINGADMKSENTGSRRRPSVHEDSGNPYGVDGPDELAAAVG